MNAPLATTAIICTMEPSYLRISGDQCMNPEASLFIDQR